MPIKMTIANANPAFPCEIIGATPVEVWSLMSDLVKVLSIKKCGHCESENLFPESRPVETEGGKKFMGHKWRCEKCGSSLLVRATEEGTLYITWDEEWYKPEKAKDPTPPI